MILVKIHKSYRDIVAICDSELLGKKFEEDKLQLDLTTQFFRGEEKTEEEAFDIINEMATEDATFNIIGEKSIALALKAEIITEEGIKKVQGIPFTLVLM